MAAKPPVQRSHSIEVLIEELECPVCCQTPRGPPIYQCENGHLLCCSCRSRISVCPQGKCLLSEQRSRLAENLLERNNLPRPCKFSISGCPFEDSIEALIKHEFDCSYRKVICPDLDCCEAVMENALLDHLINEHEFRREDFEASEKSIDECFWIVDGDDLTLRSISGTWPLSIWRFKGQVFFSMLIKQRNERLWHAWIYFLGSMEAAKSFKMIVTVKNKDESETVSYRGVAHSIDENEENILQSGACLTLTDSLVGRFITSCPRSQTTNENEEDQLKFLLRISYEVEEVKC